MSISVKLKKGLDLSLAGAVEAPRADAPVIMPASVAVTPDDFTGFIPKTEVREGDTVKAGQPLLRDKNTPEMKLVSPAAGTVKAVVRGERRKIERVTIEVNPAGEAVVFDSVKALADADAARKLLMESGLWAYTRQRPYDIVTDPKATIRDIFVTGFDSAPLAVSREAFTPETVAHLEAAVKLLNIITEGKVYITRRASQQMPDIKGAEMVDVTGPHPAGNAGPVIAAIRPVNKGETVMTLSIDTLDRIGSLLTDGTVPATTTVALTGSELREPKMVKTLVGADMTDLLKGEIAADGRHHRIISGNVLTGVAVPADGYLRFPYTQVTVIPEGDDVDEFMGWASLSPSKMSTSFSFPSRLFGKKRFSPDARLLGGRRAMIMSGEYDKVFPMDILPEYLVKAVLAKDIDRMEQLGIYEVAPEDFALAEYADTSKLELQKIIRQGLDYLRKELQ